MRARVVVCVPRNMQQAAGMYNTLLQSDDPPGDRMPQRLPQQGAHAQQPRRVHRAHRHWKWCAKGSDLTLVSYGSTFNLCCKSRGPLERPRHPTWN
jgi:2-oxoisovalerate dehydrogenase E1 component